MARRTGRTGRTNNYTEIIICSAVTALIAALMFIFDISQPLTGYTLMIITVCIGGILGKQSGGLIVGLVAGIASFICGFPAAVLTSPAIYKLLICVLSKMLAGWLSALLYSRLSRYINNILAGVICVIVGLVANACGVCIVLLIGSLLNDTLGSINLVKTVKDILYSFVRLGKAVVDILIP